MAYIQTGLGTGIGLGEPVISADLLDAVEVFVYTNLSIIISPNPTVPLTNSLKSILLAYVNRYPGAFLPPDLQQVADAWVLTHINSFTEPTTLPGG